jgi:hypothetical protein
MSRKRYADDFDDYNEEVIVLPESPPSPDEYEDNILYKYMTYSNGIQFFLYCIYFIYELELLRN